MNRVFKDFFKGSSGKWQQKSPDFDWEISGEKKRCSTKLCNIMISEPEEKNGSTNNDKATAMDQLLS